LATPACSKILPRAILSLALQANDAGKREM